MDTSYRTCPNQSAPLAPKWAFLHLSKWHHHSSHCSRQHFLIPYIKPNSKFCWLLLWKRSWLQAFLPNPSASTLVEAPMTFHGDSAISTQCIQLSPVPFYSPFPHIAPGVPLLAWSSHAPSENPAVPPPPRSQPNENQTPGLQAAGARMGPHPPPLISPRPPAFPHRALVPWPPHSASHMTSSLPPRSFHGGFSMPSGGSSPVALYGSLLLLDVCFESSPFHSF